MTREEHIARAMLMGGWYGDRAHIYYFRDGGEKVRRLDADTLEPLTSLQTYERIKNASAARARENND